MVSFVSYYHPGDEYGIYAYSNIIGVWPFFFLRHIPIQNIFFPIIVATTGAAILILAGWGLDKLKTDRKIWFVLWMVFTAMIFVLSVMQYPTISKALSKNGSWTAYIAGSLNIALYVSVVLAAIAAFMVSIIKKYKFV
jgi:hypothetical protein